MRSPLDRNSAEVMANASIGELAPRIVLTPCTPRQESHAPFCEKREQLVCTWAKGAPGQTVNQRGVNIEYPQPRRKIRGVGHLIDQRVAAGWRVRCGGRTW